MSLNDKYLWVKVTKTCNTNNAELTLKQRCCHLYQSAAIGCFTNDFSFTIQIKKIFCGKSAVGRLDCYEILHMPRQQSRHGICKNHNKIIIKFE